MAFGSMFVNSNILGDALISTEKKKLQQKYKFPASVQTAKRHLQAAKFHPTSTIDQEPSIEKCPCCNMRINTQILSVTKTETTPLDDTECYLPSSVALFFSFIKCMIILMVIRFLVVDIFNFITNLASGSFCYSKCSQEFWSLASLIHKYDRKDLINVTDILSFVTIIVLFVYFMMVRKLLYTLYCNIDQNNQTEDDFTIFVENIPILDFPSEGKTGEIKFEYEKDLEELFTEEIKKWLRLPSQFWEQKQKGTLEYDYMNFRENNGDRYSRLPSTIVQHISLCYDVSKIERIRELRRNLMEKYQAEFQKYGQCKQIEDISCKYNTIPAQIEYLNQSELNVSQQYVNNNDNISKMTIFCGAALISFKYQHFRNYIINMYQKDKHYFSMKGNYLKIKEAPSPSDILWENLAINNLKRKERILTSFIILIIFLLFAFGALLGSDRLKMFVLRKLQQSKEFEESQNQGINWAEKSITMGITVITLIINYILQVFAYGLTKWQKHKTKANEKLSLVAKLLATQFLNTAMILLVISIIDKEDNSELLGSNGLVYKISYLLVMSGVIQIVTNLLNFSVLIRFITIKLFEWNLNDPEKVGKFQINLNKQYQLIEFDIAERYSYYLLQLYAVSFYAYIVPVCVPAVALIFCCQYWVDKLNLFKRSSLIYQLNYSLSRNILKIAQCSVVIFSFGAVYFSMRINGEVSSILIMALIFSIVYLAIIFLIPSETERKVFQPYEECEIYSYNQCLESGKFHESYWKKNPVTMLKCQKNSKSSATNTQVTSFYNFLGDTQRRDSRKLLHVK